ncbi:unnamed protein product [Ceratitis capitata]|uniref:Gustatory receptor n=1 Tax=Ceratitis capitata TaxID=7213 RepID=A0A811UI99_CERCA|nr:unnamed protein product [Ceratitis capitata]
MLRAKARSLKQILATKRHCKAKRGKLTTAYCIFSEIKWLVYILTACGLLPFYEIISDSEIARKKGLFASLYTTIVRILCLLVITTNSYTLFSLTTISYSFFGSVDLVNYVLHMFLNIFCFAVIIFSCAVKSRHFLRAANKLLLIDGQLQRYANNTDCLENGCAFQWKYFIYLETSICNFFIIFIALLCHLLFLRFRYLNRFVKSFTNGGRNQKLKQQLRAKHSTENPIFYITLPEERVRPKHEIQQESFISVSSYIYRSYYELLKIYKQLNEYVGHALLVYFIYVFYLTSLAIYRMIYRAKSSKLSKFPLYGFASLILHMSILVLVTRCCSKLTEEAQKIASIIANIYGRNEKSRKVTDKFLTTNLKSDLQFTACKVFTIDNSTLFKLCCAVATYLAILGQFCLLEKSRSEH